MAEQESMFRTFLQDGLDLEVYLVVLYRLLTATSKKGRQLFLGKKCTADKILATPINNTTL